MLWIGVAIFLLPLIVFIADHRSAKRAEQRRLELIQRRIAARQATLKEEKSGDSAPN